MSLLKKFPFLEPLPEAIELVAGEQPPRGLNILLSHGGVVARAASKLSAVLGGRYPWGIDETVEDSLASSAVFFLAVAAAGGSSASRVLDSLSRLISGVVEGLDARSLIEALSRAGVRVELVNLSIPWLETGSGVTPLILQWRVHVSSFLAVSAGSEEPLLALSNQFLKAGWVYLDISRLRALASRALYLAARSRLEEAASLLEDWAPPEPLRRLAALVKLKLGSEKLPYSRETLPPCISRLLGRLESGRGLSDEEAYTLLTFLSRLEMPGDEEARLASLMGLEREAFTSILAAASRYPVPSCGSLSKAGVCKCRGSLLESYRRRLEEAFSEIAGAANP